MLISTSPISKLVYLTTKPEGGGVPLFPVAPQSHSGQVVHLRLCSHSVPTRAGLVSLA